MTNLIDYRVTDGITQVLAAQYNRVIDSVLRGELSNTETLAANKTLIDADYPLQVYAPTAARDVTLPAVAAANHPFHIVNTSTAYLLTVKNAGGTIIGYVPVSGAVAFFSNATGWYQAGTNVGFIPLQSDGWERDTNIWTYASASTFTVTGDVTATLKKGTKIKWTQTTVKYGVVVSSSYGAGTTTVTIAVNTDYTVVNAAISLSYYSSVDPLDFPQEFSFTPSWTNLSVGNGTLVSAKYRVTPDRIRGHVEFTWGTTTSVSGNVSLAVPVTSGVTHNYIPCGNAALIDTGTYLYHGSIMLVSGSFSIRCLSQSGSYYGYSYVTATVPFTFGNTDVITLNFDYPW